MPEIPGFCGPSYLLDTPNAEKQITRNLYTEPIEKGPRTGKIRLRSIPGLQLFLTLPKSPIRALWSSTVNQFPTATAQCFAIAGDGLYQIFADPTVPPVFIGPVGNGPNPGIVTSNGFQLAIASNGQG